MKQRLQHEHARLMRFLSGLDRQTTTVLMVAAFFGMWKNTLGRLGIFRHEIAPALGLSSKGISPFLYLFGSEFVTGFVIPALVLWLVFKRRPTQMGLGLGDWRFSLFAMGVYMPLVTVGAWCLSVLPSFQRKYPLYDGAHDSLSVFLVFELFFLLYWLGWEYLWRGFCIFGTRHSLGYWAIFVQMLPFAALHANKPIPEAYLSIVGAVALGMVVWRAGSFWIAVPIHAWQMMMMDLFCTLRVRSGVDGIGPEALIEAVRGGLW